MVDPMPAPVKKLWDEWNIRWMMLLSLSMETFLILFAPLRKSTANKLIAMLLWSVYLLADWVAVASVSLISNSKHESNKPSTPSPGPYKNGDLLVIWPPFLLLHLGGTDTITAFALEDNELWIRHLLCLIFQAGAAIYIFLLSLPQTRLVAPTIMMLLAGSIKYFERTRASYLASVDRFRDSCMLKEPDPRSNYVGEYPCNNLEVVQRAHQFFNIFKGLVVNLIPHRGYISESCSFFTKLTPEDALRIIEVELNLVYDVFYTKIQVAHSVIGCITRFTSFGLVVASFMVFNFHEKNQFYKDFDVKITYILFWGVIGLDALAFFMLLFSDWTLLTLKFSGDKSKLKNRIESSITHLLNWFLNFKNPRWHECQMHLDRPTHKVLATPLLFCRWSGHLSRHSMISYCLKVRPIKTHRANNCVQRALRKIIHYMGIIKFIEAVENAMSMFSHFLGQILGKIIQFLGPILRKAVDYFGIDSICFVDEIKYVSHEPLPKQLWEFIFCQLEERATSGSAEGYLVLKEEAYSEIYDKLMPYLNDESSIQSKRHYDESLLLWHVATDLLYFTEDNEVVTGEKYIPHCNFSKLLSDYMSYLMVMQPSFMYANAGAWKKRFRHTCEVVNEIFNTRDVLESPGLMREKAVCERILGLHDASESVLFDASMLAKELKKLEQEKRWELMSKIWVELLVYAACNYDARAHAKQVSKGGELVTFVWLLMTHFGLVHQLQFPNFTIYKIQ